MPGRIAYFVLSAAAPELYLLPVRHAERPGRGYFSPDAEVIHRAMLLFGLGRSTLLRQVLEKELHQSKRFERLALSLNALYPDGSDERRMLEGVQAAMRGVR